MTTVQLGRASPILSACVTFCFLAIRANVGSDEARSAAFDSLRASNAFAVRCFYSTYIGN